MGADTPVSEEDDADSEGEEEDAAPVKITFQYLRNKCGWGYSKGSGT